MTLKSWLSLLKMFAPMVLKQAGVPDRYVDNAVELIGHAEALKVPGVDKKAHVIAGLVNVLQAGKVKEMPQIIAAASQGIDLTISIVKMMEKVEPPAPVILDDPA
jgi:hypothetical protein